MHKAVASIYYPLRKSGKERRSGRLLVGTSCCSYIAEFEKPKIIFSEIVSEPQFFYDEEGYYPEATVFFMSGEKIEIFNSFAEF
jgi:hypothetical protein